MANIGTQDQPIQSPTWQKFTVPYTQLQTAALTNAVTLLSLPSKGIVHYAWMNITQAFSGTTTLTLSLGPSGSLTKYIAASTALATGSTSGVNLTSVLPESVSGSTNVQVNATATIQNLSSLTQGSVDIYLLISTLN